MFLFDDNSDCERVKPACKKPNVDPLVSTWSAEKIRHSSADVKSAVAGEAPSRRDKKEAIQLVTVQMAAPPCGSSPVRARPLRRQLHPVHRVVAVVVHDLRQAKVGDLDLAARRAVHQQDVSCGGANPPIRAVVGKFREGNADTDRHKRAGQPPGPSPAGGGDLPGLRS